MTCTNASIEIGQTCYLSRPAGKGTAVVQVLRQTSANNFRVMITDARRDVGLEVTAHRFGLTPKAA